MQSLLARGILLTLLLALAGFFLSALAASAAPVAPGVGQAAAVSPFKPPTRTPRPSPTPTATRTPSPTPTATGVPSPTAVATPTATVIPTASSTDPGGPGSESRSLVGGGDRGDQSMAFLGSLLGWGVMVVLVFAVTIMLLTRRRARAEPQLVAAWTARRAARPWLNRLRQMLSGRHARAPLEEEQTREMVPPEPESPSLAPVKPPRWLINAGLLKEETGEQPTPDPQDLRGKGQESRDGGDATQSTQQRRRQFRMPHAFEE